MKIAILTVVFINYPLLQFLSMQCHAYSYSVHSYIIHTNTKSKAFLLYYVFSFSLLSAEPEDQFFDNLRYLHGFVPLQNLIDSALLNHMEVKEKFKFEVQQMPYPCWHKDL